MAIHRGRSAEVRRGEDAGLQMRLHQADLDSVKQQHSQLQDHINKNPIKVPVQEHTLSTGAHRQAFSRSVKWASSRADARRSRHENLVDHN
jgi:hypothetical protein